MRMASVNSVAQGPMTSRGVNGYVSWWYMNVDRNPLAWGRWNMVLTNSPCILGTPDIVGDGDDVGSVVGRGRGGDEEEGGWSHCHGCSGGGPRPSADPAPQVGTVEYTLRTAHSHWFGRVICFDVLVH